MQYARRNQSQHKFAFAYANRMTGVVPSLVAGDNVKVRGEYINDFAFAFVSPLGSDYYDVFHINQELSVERLCREPGSRSQFHVFARQTAPCTCSNPYLRWNKFTGAQW